MKYRFHTELVNLARDNVGLSEVRIKVRPCYSQPPSQFERLNKDWSGHETKLFSGIFGGFCNKRIWPAAMFVDDLVDLTHDAVCLTDGNDDLLVVVYVFVS